RRSGPVARKRLVSRAGSSHSPCLPPSTRPRYGSTISVKLWRNSTRRSPLSAQNRPVTIRWAMPRPMAQPISAPRARAIAISRSRQLQLSDGGFEGLDNCPDANEFALTGRPRLHIRLGHDAAAEPHLRRLAHAKRRLRDAADFAGETDLAEHGGRRRNHAIA